MRIKRPRYKNSPLSIEETFPPPHENVKVIIIAHLGDLSDLAIDYYETLEELGKIFLNHFLDRACYEIVTRFGLGKPPRGVHKKTWEFTQKMKTRAPYTFGVVDYWLKKPQEKWPKSVKKLINEFEDQLPTYAPLFGRKKKPKAHEVTAYIMERNFGKERAKNKPTSNPWTDDPEAFRKTYILGSHFMNWVKMKLDDLEKAGIKLPHELPIISEKPSALIFSLFSNPSVTSSF